MFGIVLFHAFYFGVHPSVSYKPTVLMNAAIGNFAGDFNNWIFILISGYFLSCARFKKERLLKIWSQVFFYSVVIGLVFFIFKIATVGFYSVDAYKALGYETAAKPIGKIELIRSFLPTLMGNNWFATCYILFYLFTPPLYILIDNLSRKEHLNLVLLMFVAGCCISMLPGQNVLHASRFYYFILGYFAASYIKKYDPPVLNHTGLNFIISITIIVFLAAWKVLLIVLSEKIPLLKSDFARFLYLGGNIDKAPVFIAALLCFCAFKNINIPHNRVINLISSTTFGIYLLHVNGHLKYFIWHRVFRFDEHVGSPDFVFYVLLSSLAVFFAFSITDLLRQFFVEKAVQKFFCRKK